jgi:perosamine synthetase
MKNKEWDYLAKTIIKFCGKPPVDLSHPEISKKDINIVSRELKNKNVALGPCINLFKKKLSKITGAKYISLVSSGTSGLYVILKSYGISIDHEVLLPSFNYIASANSVILCGASPHFVDSSLLTMGVDFKNLDIYLKENTIFKKKRLINIKTKKNITALIITHVFGHPENMQEAKEICKKYNLILIEDASEGLGSYYLNEHVGTVGDAGVLSFNGNKIITTGGGGAVIIKSKKRHNIIEKIINNGRIINKKHEFLFNHVGLNLKMPNLNAALGMSQIDNLKKFINKRKKLFKLYNSSLLNYFKVISEPHFGKSNYWLQAIRIKNIDEKKKNNKIFN